MMKLTVSLIALGVAMASMGFAEQKSEYDPKDLPKPPTDAILVKADASGHSVAYYKAEAFNTNTLQGEKNLEAYVKANAVAANEIKDATVFSSDVSTKSEYDRQPATQGFWGWRVGPYWGAASVWGWGWNNVAYTYNWAYSWSWPVAAPVVYPTAYTYPVVYTYPVYPVYNAWAGYTYHWYRRW
jgi:hypothetical protein